MSKSKFNGVDPNEIINKYGCDTTRWLILCDVGPMSDRKWSEDSYRSIRDIQIRTMKLLSLAISLQQEGPLPPLPEGQMEKYEQKLWDDRNYYLKVSNISWTIIKHLNLFFIEVTFPLIIDCFE